MTELNLRPDLAEQIQAIARREHRAVDEVVEALLTQYTPPAPLRSAEEEQRLLREDRQRTYKRARQYWQSVNDERQQLTDEQMEEQFWLFDEDGVPHLRSEEATLNLPPDPWLEAMALMEADTTITWGKPHDSSEHTKEILNKEYTDYLIARRNRNASGSNE